MVSFGIINLDGAPIDYDLLNRLTNYLGFRGPDAQYPTWSDGNAGLGRTMLRTTCEAEDEKSSRCPLTAKFGSRPTPASMHGMN